MPQREPTAVPGLATAAVTADLMRDGGSEIAESKNLRFLERFLPNPKPDDAASDRRQQRILAGLSLVFLCISMATIGAHAYSGTTQGVVAGVAVGICGFGLLAAIRTGYSPVSLGHGVMWPIYGLSVGITIASGGETVTSIFTACFIPLLAAVLDRPKNVTRWTVAAIAGVGIAALYSGMTDSFPFESNISHWQQFRFPVMVVGLILVYAGTLVLDWARGAAIDEMRSSKQELDQQSERYRSLVENVGDVIMEYDADTHCLFVSRNCLEMSGWSDSEFLGTRFLTLIHPDDLLSCRKMTSEIKHSAGATRRIALRIQHKQGRWINGEMSARSFITEDNTVHFVTIFRDVTELRRATIQVRHAERLATTGTLAAGVAHQINNPIGSILNSSEYALLCVRDGDISGVESVLEGNVEQATRCGAIVRSLLQFASRDAPEMSKHDLTEIVKGARDFTKTYAQERGIDIEFDAPGAPVWVNVSAIEIEQVGVNLMRNAVESGPMSHLISVVVTQRDGVARCIVRDDGCGIPEVDSAQVFDPFFTTRVREGGSGLGLSVAHGIVRDHAGSMALESSAGKGTQVSIELPLYSELTSSETETDGATT